jgi:hypothetical protein
MCDLENLVNEEAMAHWGAVVPKTNNIGSKIKFISRVFPKFKVFDHRFYFL